MQDFFDALVDIFLWLPRMIYSTIVDVIEFFLALLPDAPAQGWGDLFNSLPGELLYFSTIFQVPEGIAMIMTAYLARFILRRIPGIG